MCERLATCPHARFFAVGALIITPLVAAIVWGTHALFEERPRWSITDEWSEVFYGPFIEEVFKLLPLGVFCLFSRRSRSFGICDYMLVGAASGTGFLFMEEMVRRWASSVQISILTLIDQALGTEYNWQWDVLFPGLHEQGHDLYPGHHIWTAFVALGIGLAIHLRKTCGRVIYLIPLMVFSWAVFDHSSFNDSTRHWSVDFIYDLLGNGHYYRWLFILCFIVAIYIDYVHINRQNPRLPRLQGEQVIDPVSELLLLLQSLCKGAQAFGHMLAFTRERHQLAFTMVREINDRHVDQFKNIFLRRFTYVAAMFATVLLLLIGVETVASLAHSGDSAYIAGLVKYLSTWWNDLSTVDKAAIIITTVVIGGLLTLATGGGFLAGGFTALGAALTVQEVLEEPDPVIFAMNDPRGAFNKWRSQFYKLPPQEAARKMAEYAIRTALERLPAKKVLDAILKHSRKGVQLFTKKLFRDGTQVEMPGFGRIHVDDFPDTHWQANRHGDGHVDRDALEGTGNANKKFSDMSADEQLAIAKQYSQRAPIEIPENANMKAKSMADGYEQITYKWNDGIYKYEVRWHT